MLILLRIIYYVELQVDVRECPTSFIKPQKLESTEDATQEQDSWFWITSSSNTWAHSRRRKRKRQQSLTDDASHKSRYTLEKNILENTDIDDKNGGKSGQIKEQKYFSNHDKEQGQEHTVAGCLFHCFLALRIDHGKVTFDFEWIFGSDKDALNQFAVFIGKQLNIT